jgi:heme-degrading monooxygenase HmoA
LFARVHTIQANREQHEVDLEIVREEFLPWVRDSTGFRGLLSFLDEEQEKALVISLWADEAALEESAEAGDRLSRLTARVSGSSRRSLESYEVTLFEVLPDE